MSNQYGQSDADPAANQPTQQFWAGPDAATAPPAWGGQPGAAGPGGGPGFTGNPGPGLQEHLKKDRRRALHWTAGLLAAALLLGGGTIAGMALAAHSSPAASSGATPGQAGPATSAQQGALLDETLSDASAPGALNSTGAALARGAGAAAGGAAAGGAAKAPVCTGARHVSRAARRAGLPRLARRLGAARCRLARHRVFAFFLLRGVDGQFTIQTRQGTKTLAYERGVIQSVTAGKSITVKASDGTTWTWDLVSTTVIRDGQGKVSQSELTTGTPVWAGGPVVSGAKDARLIVVRPPQPASVTPSSTPGS
jgi:hypothetical protein